MDVMLAMLVLWAVAFSPPEGAPIVAIRVVRQDVFDLSDPRTASWPYRTANALHVLTRARFIRGLLLFREGDPWDPQLAAESERILRATGFLNPVRIYPQPAPGGVEVVVETRDQWTTEVATNYGRLGQRQKAGLSLSEQNFLGWGKTVFLDARWDAERDSLTFGYSDPLFLRRRWRLELAHREASDGTADKFSCEYPFFALATPWAGGIRWQRASQVEYLWAQGKKAVSGDTLKRSLEIWLGMRLSGDGQRTNRLIGGLFAERAAYSRWAFLNGNFYPEPEDRELAGVFLGWESQSSAWQVVKGFRGWWRQEDVPLGPNLSLRVGASVPRFAGKRWVFPFSLMFLQGAWQPARYAWWLANADGRWEKGRLWNGRLRLEAGMAFVGDRGLRARVVLERGLRLDRDQQLTLGANTGLRGWDPDTFDGTSRALVNVEWRQRLTGEVLHLAVLGVTIFADAGKTWGARVGADTGGWRKDVGAGLLVEITRAAILRVVRVELAYPDRGKGPTLLLTGASLF